MKGLIEVVFEAETETSRTRQKMRFEVALSASPRGRPPEVAEAAAVASRDEPQHKKI